MLWSNDKKKKKKKRQIRTSVPQLYPSLPMHPPESGLSGGSHCPQAATLRTSGDGGSQANSGVLAVSLSFGALGVKGASEHEV